MVALLCLHRDGKGIRDVMSLGLVAEGAAGQHQSKERQAQPLCDRSGADSWETYFHAMIMKTHTCTARQN